MSFRLLHQHKQHKQRKRHKQHKQRKRLCVYTGVNNVNGRLHDYKALNPKVVYTVYVVYMM